jgi:signal transduction histidine kinase
MNGTERTRAQAWAVNAGLVACAVAFGLFPALYRSNVPGTAPLWLLHIDQVAGALGCLLLFWRRRWPVGVTVVLVVFSLFSETVSGALFVALFTVAIHRSARASVPLLGAALVGALGLSLLRPEPSVPLAVAVALTVAMNGGATAWGLAVRNRRQLVASLRERAEAAAVEGRLRAERAQHEARETIAREMHDVLGHRLSLLSVHAGAMVYNRDARPEELLRVAEVIRENSHRALQDLREVIGVLRAPTAELPLPGIADVAELVEEARRAGNPVELADDAGVTTLDHELPTTVGRTLYRFVQEGLTNVRKHAPGASVRIVIGGEPAGKLTAEVLNSAPTRPCPAPPGSGEGLRGLGERAALVGGGIEHGVTERGGWRLAMWLPWPR